MTAATTTTTDTATTTTTPTSHATRRLAALRRIVAPGLVAVGLAVGALATTGAQPAAALTQVQVPSDYYCENGNIRVAPARAWATYGTEPVGWANRVERWNGSAWVAYATYTNIGMFDYFGRNQSGWTMTATTSGGTYVNSRLSLPVQHRGYYRVFTVVGNDSLYSKPGFIGGAGTYCYMP